MSGYPVRIFPAIFIVSIILLAGVGRGSAQSEAVVKLFPPDSAQFPHISAYLDVHDMQGSFVHGLTLQDVTVQEDNIAVPVSELNELNPGIQFVIAISPGASFGIRDGMGVSRYESFIQGFLASTWAAQSEGIDDFSLLALGGPQLTHTSDPSSIKSALESYSIGELESEPGLEILASALQIASDPVTHPGMERAILFITSPQETDVSLGLQSIIASANQQNVHIYVWVLASEEAFQAPEINQLRHLADQTGGTFWGFTHDEAVPDLETLLEPLRNIYQLGYDSQVKAPGSHQVIAQVSVDGNTITSQAQDFEVGLQPPAVSILSLPDEITRTYSIQPTPGPSEIGGDLLPIEQVVKLKIAFPDGYEHSIVQTRLYVDGTVVAENVNPPYDQFTWDIRPYTQDGTHTLLAEATDNLGLVGKSPEISVNITVPSTAQGMMVVVSQKSPLIFGALLVVLSSILVLALIVGGRIRPKPHPGQPKPGKGSGRFNHPPDTPRTIKEQDNTLVDALPVSEPSLNKSSFPLYRWLERLPWLKRKEAPMPARAYLIPLVGFDEPTLPASLQIVSDDISLGTDPQRAGLVIHDPSIDGIHASIHHDGNSYVITDAGTVAGTWVNYVQVPPSGTELVHMDIIHLGRIGFRFRLSEPGQLRSLIVTPLEPKQ